MVWFVHKIDWKEGLLFIFMYAMFIVFSGMFVSLHTNIAVLNPFEMIRFFDCWYIIGSVLLISEFTAYRPAEMLADWRGLILKALMNK